MTKTIWKLTTESGVLKLEVEGGGLDITLRPVSANHYQSVDATFEMKVHFENGPSAIMHAHTENEKHRFEKLTPVEVNLDLLREYTGNYHCEDLPRSYELAIDNRGLENSCIAGMR